MAQEPEIMQDAEGRIVSSAGLFEKRTSFFVSRSGHQKYVTPTAITSCLYSLSCT